MSTLKFWQGSDLLQFIGGQEAIETPEISFHFRSQCGIVNGHDFSVAVENFNCQVVNFLLHKAFLSCHENRLHRE